ncbi:MAG: hypothetical protein ACM3YM_06510 [Sphingomonadales bacterium]
MLLGRIAHLLARWLHQLAAWLEAAGARASANPAVMVALAERFPGAPDHWLAAVAEHLAAPLEADRHSVELPEDVERAVAPERAGAARGEPLPAVSRRDRTDAARAKAPPRKRRPPLRFLAGTGSTPGPPTPAQPLRRGRRLVRFAQPVREERPPPAHATPGGSRPARFRAIGLPPARAQPAGPEQIAPDRADSPSAGAIGRWPSRAQSVRQEPIIPDRTGLPDAEPVAWPAAPSPRWANVFPEPVPQAETPETMIGGDPRERRSELRLPQPAPARRVAPAFGHASRTAPVVPSRTGPDRLDWPQLPPSDRVVDAASTEPLDADFRHEQMVGLWSA